MKVPFIDLHREYLLIKKEVKKKLSEVLDKSEYCFGQETVDFEKTLCQIMGCRYVISVGSGTQALEIALKALNIGRGDEVITTPFTFVATAEAIVNVGARPVFVDINEETFNIDVAKIPAAITKKTKAILPVHLYGVCADMNEILTLGRKHHLFVIEDSAQAFGSLYQHKMAGTLGDIGCLSFYPTKTLGAYGNAGLVVTNAKALAEKIRAISDHGRQESRYLHREIGTTGSIDNLQAAILNIKLKYITEKIARRKEIALRYSEEFAGLPVKKQEISKECDPALYVYTLKTAIRDVLVSYLKKEGIGTGIYYPIPLHLQPSLAFLNYHEGSFPVSEKISKEVFSLPFFPEMTEREISEVVKTVKAFST